MAENRDCRDCRFRDLKENAAPRRTCTCNEQFYVPTEYRTLNWAGTEVLICETCPLKKYSAEYCKDIVDCPNCDKKPALKDHTCLNCEFGEVAPNEGPCYDCHKDAEKWEEKKVEQPNCNKCKFRKLESDQLPCVDCNNNWISGDVPREQRPLLLTDPAETDCTICPACDLEPDYCKNYIECSNAQNKPIPEPDHECGNCLFGDVDGDEEPCASCRHDEGWKPKEAKGVKEVTGDDVINHPEHYTFGKYECIEEMIHLFGIDAVIAFCKCNVYKYRFRAGHKNGAEDIKKAEWYMGKIIELQEQMKLEREDI